MKKRLLSILLTVLLMATALLGCGAKDAGNAVISLDELTGTISVTEAESSVDQSADAETSIEQDTEQNSEASVEASSTTEDNADSSKNTENIDWATAYDNYFEENVIYRENIMVKTNVVVDTVEMCVEMSFNDETFYMGFDFGRAAVDLYGTEDMVYSRSVMGNEETWSYATITSEEEAESIKSMGTTTVDNDSIVSWTYKEEVTENDIVYDLLDVIGKASDGGTKNMVCYVNRETQKIDKLIVEQNGTELIAIIEDIEELQIPKVPENAKESTVEDIIMELVSTMIAVSLVHPQ